jgi:hypothetical protein
MDKGVVGLEANYVCLCLEARSLLPMNDDGLLIIFPNSKQTPLLFPSLSIKHQTKCQLEPILLCSEIPREAQRRKTCN